MWEPFGQGKTINTKGFDDGIIFCDEVYRRHCRVTLEKETPIAPYAIIVELYGRLADITYARSEREAFEKYEKVKRNFEKLLTIA